jgi:hypothetical protein
MSVTCPCHFEILTADKISSWVSGDNQAATAAFTTSLGQFSAVENVADSAGNAACQGFRRVLYEMCWHVLVDAISGKKAVELMMSCDMAPSAHAPAALADCLWLAGMEIEHADGVEEKDKHGTPEWSRLCGFVKEIGSQKLVTLVTLKSILEPELLEGAGLVLEAKGFKSRLIKMNTKNLCVIRLFSFDVYSLVFAAQVYPAEVQSAVRGKRRVRQVADAAV